MLAARMYGYKQPLVLEEVKTPETSMTRVSKGLSGYTDAITCSGSPRSVLNRKKEHFHD